MMQASPSLDVLHWLRLGSCLVVLTSPVPAPAQNEPVANTFYRSLADAVQNAKGTMVVDLTAGYWQGDVQGRKVRWANSEGTVGQLSFDYRAGVLQSASITFRPAVHLWVVMATGPDLALGVNSVTYSSLGDQEEWDVFYDRQPPPTNPNALATLRKALRISRTPADLLAGKLFSGYPGVPCSPKYLGCAAGKPLVTQIRFLKIDEQSPGLSIDLKRNSVLWFSKAQGGRGFDNFVTVRRGSIVLDDLEYDVQSKHLHGTLEQVRLEAEAGQLLSKDIAFRIGGGSDIQFDRLMFRRESNGESEVNAEFGTLNLALGNGSRLGLSAGVPNSSYLVFDDGTSLKLQGFTLNVNAQRSATIRVGGGSSVTANVRDGRLGFGSSGWVGLQSATIVSSLRGTWDSSARPDADLNFSALDAVLSGGVVDLNAASHVTVGSGSRLKSSDLRFQGLSFAGLAGTISDFTLLLADPSQFAIPGGFVVTTVAGASIGTHPGEALLLKPGYAYPIGGSRLDLPFKRFSNAAATTFAVSDGRLGFDLVSSEDGSIAGSNGTLSGRLALESDIGVAELKVEGENGVFSRTAQGGFELSMGFKGEIQPGLSFTIESPFIKGFADDKGESHADARFFPVKVVATLPSATAVERRTLSFKNGVVNLAEQVITPSFKVTVPTGLGEHQDRDNVNSADGTHGPDKLQKWQEATFDDHAICDHHIYLAPAEYAASSELKYAIEDGVVRLSVGKLKLDRPAEFTVDGCDTEFMLTIVGAVGGFIAGGPVGASAGAVAGYNVGGDLKSHINALIGGLVARKLQELERSWRVRIPPS